jgi:class 3 adenylate cyclase
MSDLRDWLRKNKLDQYADAFEANDIDFDILSELTEHDLEKLGMSLGNRRRLVKAIAERAGGESASTSMPAPELDSGVSSEAERRQVTVLFCDLVGSTALSGAIDPEPLGTLIRRYQDAAAGAIGRFGGFVAKFMGDGVLAYFGFPRAFEDAAERAVRAAISILAEVGGIAGPDGTRFQARIGIATGLVVVGEIVGTGSAQEHTIVGKTPNLAARLQSLAAPDTILISEATQHLLGGMFDLEPIGEHELKGFARPVPVWRVRGEASVESRFAAIRTRGNTVHRPRGTMVIDTVGCATSMPSLRSSPWILGAPHSGFSILNSFIGADRAPLCRSAAGHRADGISIANTRRSPFGANAQQSRA